MKSCIQLTEGDVCFFSLSFFTHNSDDMDVLVDLKTVRSVYIICHVTASGGH